MTYALDWAVDLAARCMSEAAGSGSDQAWKLAEEFTATAATLIAAGA